MIDLHYWTTPNGHKVAMFLEESALPYRIVPVNISKGDQLNSWRFPQTTAFQPSSITARRMAASQFRYSNPALFCFISLRRPECFSPVSFAGRLA